MSPNSGSSENNENLDQPPFEQIEPEIVDKSPEIYQKVFDLMKVNFYCMECLGRQFSYLATNTDNTSRAEALLLGLTMESHRLLKMNTLEKHFTLFNQQPLYIIYVIALSTHFEPAITLLSQLEQEQPEILEDYSLDFSQHTCSLCQGYLTPKSVDTITNLILNRIKGYEFENFMIGTFVNPVMENKEEEIRAKYQLQMGESFKANINRVFGKKIRQSLKKEPELKRPDLRIMIDLREDPNIQIKCYTLPVFIQGRYLKFTRKYPQTHWNCYHCHGSGIDKRSGNTCPICAGKGDFFSSSIHELIDHEITPLFGGEGSKFHGSGREDIKTLCLGEGRPFILEIKNPKHRSLDLDEIVHKINAKLHQFIHIKEVKYVTKQDVQEVKTKWRKSRLKHQGMITLSKFLSEEDFQLKKREIEQEFQKLEIIQRTPLRFITFKKDTTKRKIIFNLKLDFIDELHLFLDIEAEPGLYLQEAVSGDQYRTTPSLSERLEMKLEFIDHVLFL